MRHHPAARPRLSFERLEDRSVPATGTTNVAVGDVIPSNPGNEVIVGAGVGGGPVVQVFTTSGTLLSSFFAFGESFRGGVRVAAGDLDNNGTAEIVTTPGPGGGPVVFVYTAGGTLLSTFFAVDPAYRGGIEVASGNVTGGLEDEVVTAFGPGGGPVVNVFDRNGGRLSGFFAEVPDYRGGVRVAVADVDGNGFGEIVTGLAGGAGPIVGVFDDKGGLRNKFLAYDASFRDGIEVAGGDTDDDGRDEIWVTPNAGGGPVARAFDDKGGLRTTLLAGSADDRGGVNLSVEDVNGDGIDDVVSAAEDRSVSQRLGVHRGRRGGGADDSTEVEGISGPGAEPGDDNGGLNPSADPAEGISGPGPEPGDDTRG